MHKSYCKQSGEACSPDCLSSIISGILYQVVIYLGFLSPKSSSSLPTGIRRAVFIIRVFVARISAGIFGLAAHKVYPIDNSHCLCVSSYLTFSPLPFVTLRAVIFCGTSCYTTVSGCVPSC